MKNLTTNEGQNRKGDVYLLFAFMQPIVYSISPGWGQVLVASMVFCVLAILSYRTVGSIPPEIADQIRADYEAGESLEDIIERGRR